MRILVLLAACHGSRIRTAEVVAPEPGPPPGSAEAAVGSALDAAVDPCVDFYAYACGGWIRDNPLPADRAVVHRSFTAIEDHNADLLRTVLEDAARAPGDDPGRQQLAAFWTACMDEAAIEAAGMAPLDEPLAAIRELKDKRKLLALVGDLGAAGYDVLFELGIDADPKNPGLAILALRQAGTGMADREDYLAEDRADVRATYLAYVTELFTLAGRTDAAAAAAEVVAFETRLARIQWTPEALRDPTATHNKLDRRGLERIAPGLDWAALLASRGRPELTQINVATPSFFEGTSKLVASTDLSTLRTWLEWRVLDGAASDLSSPFADAWFRFRRLARAGQQTPEPRWKRCAGAADRALGDLLAQPFVEQALPDPSAATDLVTRIEAAFEGSLEGLSWMDEDTRARAVEKARSITNQIGHPDLWRTYPFEVLPDDHFGNVRRAARFDARYWLDRAEKPIDPGVWRIGAQTVDGRYDPSQNEMLFPAGILQPPLFAVDWPVATRFGGIGARMGHELIHGFDDQGRQYDAEGRLTDWWTPATLGRFEEAVACVEAEQDPRTLRESLADLGGTRTAWRAWRRWVEEHGEEPPVVGLAGDPLFFVSFGQSWCTVASPEVERRWTVADPHGPPRERVNGALANLPEFAEAFGCELGEPMRPAEACDLW